MELRPYMLKEAISLSEPKFLLLEKWEWNQIDEGHVEMGEADLL